MVRDNKPSGHLALYRKYRSRTLDEIIGQRHITDVLRRAIDKGSVSHAYLLTGPRGVGKTSVARIIAHEINKIPYSGEDNDLDIIEIDAASNNGVEDIRDLRDKVNIAPTAHEYKIYIVDEVHMLSKAAFNALLKTLEEPPAHVVFILATTDLHKLPDTVISRTQHFSFHLIPTNELQAHLATIARAENIKISSDALNAIAVRGKGSFRDAITLLDQLSSVTDGEEISVEVIENLLGLAPTSVIENILIDIDNGDRSDIVSILDQLEADGVSFTGFLDQLILAVRSDLVDNPQRTELFGRLIGLGQPQAPWSSLLVVLLSSCPEVPSATIRPRAVPPKSTPVSPAKREDKVENKIEEPAPEKLAPEVPKAPKTSPKSKKKANADFDWEAVKKYASDKFTGLSTVLAKCEAVNDGETLTIYAANKFNKTKLDQTKYLTQLQESLINSGYPDLAIETLPSRKPSSDERIASIAAIMGGGEEISLE